MRQLSQDSLSLGALGGVTGRSDWSGMAIIGELVKEMAPKQMGISRIRIIWSEGKRQGF